MYQQQNNKNKHISVLLKESIDGLDIKPDGIYIDGTFGRGGHSEEILNKLNDNGKLIAFDRDLMAINEAKKFANNSKFTIIHSPFSKIEEKISALGLANKIDGVLLDLGVSSPQLDDASRGFSFQKDGSLDMRMDQSCGISAKDWIKETKEEDIAWVLKTFGEEKFSKRIARAIIETREKQEINTTLELAEIISKAIPVKEKHKHPATRSFQAIRIYINSELEEIKTALQGATNILKAGGRLSVISFHSLEDRIVKRFIRDQSKGIQPPIGLPLTEDQLNKTRSLKKIGKAIKPSKEEIEFNPRARSSILRIAEKLN